MLFVLVVLKIGRNTSIILHHHVARSLFLLHLNMLFLVHLIVHVLNSVRLSLNFARIIVFLHDDLIIWRVLNWCLGNWSLSVARGRSNLDLPLDLLWHMWRLTKLRLVLHKFASLWKKAFYVLIGILLLRFLPGIPLFLGIRVALRLS